MSTRLIRWIAIPALTIGMVLCSVGCAQITSKETPAVAATAGQNDAVPSVEKAREVAHMAVAMEKEPNRATEILEAHHMTRGAFENLLYHIAQDPALTEAYEAARTG